MKQIYTLGITEITFLLQYLKTTALSGGHCGWSTVKASLRHPSPKNNLTGLTEIPRFIKLGAILAHSILNKQSYTKTLWNGLSPSTLLVAAYCIPVTVQPMYTLHATCEASTWPI